MLWKKKTSPQRTALASFPKSGNTWLRILLEKATGKTSGSVYTDRVYTRTTLEGVVTKTHELEYRDYNKAIHLIRNPFDVVDSYFHHKQKMDGLQDLNWSDHLQTTTSDWKAHTAYWMEAPLPTLIVRYEDLKRDTVFQVKLITRFLGLDCSFDQIAEAVEQTTLEKMRKENPEYGDKFFRSGQIGKGIERFSSEEREIVRQSLHEYLSALGYA